MFTDNGLLSLRSLSFAAGAFAAASIIIWIHSENKRESAIDAISKTKKPYDPVRERIENAKNTAKIILDKYTSEWHLRTMEGFPQSSSDVKTRFEYLEYVDRILGKSDEKYSNENPPVFTWEICASDFSYEGIKYQGSLSELSLSIRKLIVEGNYIRLKETNEIKTDEGASEKSRESYKKIDVIVAGVKDRSIQSLVEHRILDALTRWSMRNELDENHPLFDVPILCITEGSFSPLNKLGWVSTAKPLGKELNNPMADFVKKEIQDHRYFVSTNYNQEGSSRSASDHKSAIYIGPRDPRLADPKLI